MSEWRALPDYTWTIYEVAGNPVPDQSYRHVSQLHPLTKTATLSDCVDNAEFTPDDAEELHKRQFRVINPPMSEDYLYGRFPKVAVARFYCPERKILTYAESYAGSLALYGLSIEGVRV